MTLRLLFSAAALTVALGAQAQDNILDVRDNYAIGDVVTVTGVVTSDDNLGSVRYLQDASAGIALYPGADWSDWDASPAIGDSLTVTGEITEFNGLLEIGPNLTAVIFEGAGILPTPQIITAGSMNESMEGELVQVNGATFPLAGQEIAGNNTYDFTAEGETGIIYVRTSNSLVGETLTGCAVDLVGIVSQFSFDGFGGYQLLPRGPVDLIPASGICYTTPVVQSNMSTSGFTLSWSTDLASDGVVEYGLTEALGQTAAGASGSSDHSADLSGLEAGQIYYARAISTLPDGESAVSPIRPYATVSASSGDIHVYFNGPVDTSVATEEDALSLGTDMNDTVAAWITSAQHTLDVAAYNFNDQTLEDAFNEAASNGVEIRWIYEGQNANIGLGNLDPAIVTHPRTDGEGSGMHNKFIIGDAEYTEDAFVLTGSTNLTTGNLVQDLNNAIVFEDQSLARAYTIEFEEMWGAEGMEPNASNAKFGADKSWNTPSEFLIGGAEVELYFSPTDGTTNAIREEIEAADSEFAFALLTLTRDDLGDAIATLGESFFVNPIGAIEQVNTTGSEYENLLSAGVQVYQHDISNDLHHKYAIVDYASPSFDPVVITGSHNWSSSAENVNDENTVIVHDDRIANLYHQEFRAILIALGVVQSTEDLEGEVQCLLYPNPVQESLSVEWLSDGQPGVLCLRDMSGRVVLSERLAPGVSRLSMQGVSAGVYAVSVDGQGLPTRLIVE